MYEIVLWKMIWLFGEALEGHIIVAVIVIKGFNFVKMVFLLFFFFFFFSGGGELS